MGLLGEISKNSEALRYHARTAEIAGQNLAHVNDESYARQRVLAREGVMHTSFGGLLTSGLEAGGIDHARNHILDSRVISERRWSIFSRTTRNFTIITKCIRRKN